MNILLAVCGSISAYKSMDLARLYVKNGHRVKVVLTKGALHFVRPEVYRYLGVEDVYLPTDDFTYPKHPTDKGTVLHIELARFTEKLVIAPATANTLVSLSRGEANDLLTSLFLSLNPGIPTLIFPAMNTQMLANPFTVESLKRLESLNPVRPIFIHPTSEGDLACGETGAGRLAPIEEIFALTETFTEKKSDKSILISTGATLAPLDPVRFLTNPSSGLTGVLLAKEALSRGHQVTLLATTSTIKEADDLKRHPNFKLLRLTTTEQVFEELKIYLPKSDAYISAAALCDFSFEFQDKKIKKVSEGSLNFEKSPDLLKWSIENKKPNQILIGFAAENPLTEKILLDKYNNKPVDLLVGNIVSGNFQNNSSSTGFKSQDGLYRFVENNIVGPEINLSKKELSSKLIDFAEGKK